MHECTFVRMLCCCDQQITLQISPIYECDCDSAVYVCVKEAQRALTRNVLKLCKTVLSELGLANWAKWLIHVACLSWNKPWLHAWPFELVLLPKSAELMSSVFVTCLLSRFNDSLFDNDITTQNWSRNHQPLSVFWLYSAFWFIPYNNFNILGQDLLLQVCGRNVDLSDSPFDLLQKVLLHPLKFEVKYSS